MNDECVYCHGQALGMDFGELFPSRVVSATGNTLHKYGPWYGVKISCQLFISTERLNMTILYSVLTPYSNRSIKNLTTAITSNKDMHRDWHDSIPI